MRSTPRCSEGARCASRHDSATIPTMPEDLSRRRSLLTAALVGALLPPAVPEGRMLRAWLDSWASIGHVVDAMHGTGYNVRLLQSPFTWWAEFCRDEVNPLRRWIGRASDAAPWRAVQRAALATLTRDAGRTPGRVP